jgi:multiphosphoryl transfer protein
MTGPRFPMHTHTFQCPLARGIHARPASHLQSVARSYRSNITITNIRNNRIANAHSVFSLVGADIRHGDRLCLSISGEDQDKALEAVRRYIDVELPHCDDVANALPADTTQAVLPYSLKAANPSYIRGIPTVPGVAQAPLHVARATHLPTRLDVRADADPQVEKAKVDDACRRLTERIDNQVRTRPNEVAGQILYVHQCMLNDEEFIDAIHEAILKTHKSAAQAILDTSQQLAQRFKSCENTVINERALDVEDLCGQLLDEVYGPSLLPPQPVVLDAPAILAIDHLTPSAFLGLNRDNLKGLVLGEAGTTSHTVILARARGLPTLVGIDVGALISLACREVVVDGALGLLVIEPRAQVQDYYRLEQMKHQLRQDRFRSLARRQAVTRDGAVLEVGANISCAQDAPVAFDAGADGIGLFRTEMLYMDRQTPPDEEEQLAVYRDVLNAAGSRPVIFRTLDVGGDKPVPCLGSSAEQGLSDNGRGIGFYVRFAEVFRTQVRALLRASVLGQSRIMIPMISTLDEIRWVKSVFAQAKSELTAQKLEYNASTPLGAMVETPAAAHILDKLSDEVDFFSIGTNDLTQYHLSMDRSRTHASPVPPGCHPSFIRLLAHIVEQARAHGKWIGVCGEMAADSRFVPLWLGLGISEISVAPTAIGKLKTQIAHQTLPAASLVRDLTQCRDSAEVADKLLHAQKTSNPLPIFDPEMVLTNVEAATREQALKILADRLYVTGRTDDSIAVENALWQREMTYSTGLGFGFAVPHCECEALLADTIGVIKLASPIDWSALDGKPVDILIFLGRWRDNDSAHLRAFAALSRCLMQEDFRRHLRQENDAGRIVDLLQRQFRPA